MGRLFGGVHTHQVPALGPCLALATPATPTTGALTRPVTDIRGRRLHGRLDGSPAHGGSTALTPLSTLSTPATAAASARAVGRSDLTRWGRAVSAARRARPRIANLRCGPGVADAGTSYWDGALVLVAHDGHSLRSVFPDHRNSGRFDDPSTARPWRNRGRKRTWRFQSPRRRESVVSAVPMRWVDPRCPRYLLARGTPSRVLRSHARRTTCTATPHASTLHRSAQIPTIPVLPSSA